MGGKSFSLSTFDSCENCQPCFQTRTQKISDWALFTMKEVGRRAIIWVSKLEDSNSNLSSSFTNSLFSSRQ